MGLREATLMDVVTLFVSTCDATFLSGSATGNFPSPLMAVARPRSFSRLQSLRHCLYQSYRCMPYTALRNHQAWWSISYCIPKDPYCSSPPASALPHCTVYPSAQGLTPPISCDSEMPSVSGILLRCNHRWLRWAAYCLRLAWGWCRTIRDWRSGSQGCLGS